MEWCSSTPATRASEAWRAMCFWPSLRKATKMTLLPRFTLAVLIFSQAASPATLFEGARLIVDARRPPIQNAAFVVENGHIAKVGKAGALKAPAGAARVDLSGKTVIPALVD